MFMKNNKFKMDSPELWLLILFVVFFICGFIFPFHAQLRLCGKMVGESILSMLWSDGQTRDSVDWEQSGLT